MTAVKDPDIDQLHWDAYKSLLDQGQLKERICVLWHAGSTMESARKALAEINAVPRLPATLGDDRLLSCGAKIYMDGSGGARTGWVYDDWLRNATTADVTSSGAGNSGYPQTDPAVYREMVRLFHQNGVPVGTHAVGDRAMDWVVDTYALVEQEQPAPRPAPQHHPRQPAHAACHRRDGQPAKEIRRWISGNAARIPMVDRRHLRSQLWSQARPAPGAAQDPAIPRYSLVRRVRLLRHPGRGPLWPLGLDSARKPPKAHMDCSPSGWQNRVDIHTALRSYTAWGSRQMFLEDKIGTLEVGKRADIAVWDRRPLLRPHMSRSKT